MLMNHHFRTNPRNDHTRRHKYTAIFTVLLSKIAGTCWRSKKNQNQKETHTHTCSAFSGQNQNKCFHSRNLALSLYGIQEDNDNKHLLKSVPCDAVQRSWCPAATGSMATIMTVGLVSMDKSCSQHTEIVEHLVSMDKSCSQHTEIVKAISKRRKPKWDRKHKIKGGGGRRGVSQFSTLAENRWVSRCLQKTAIYSDWTLNCCGFSLRLQEIKQLGWQWAE